MSGWFTTQYMSERMVVHTLSSMSSSSENSGPWMVGSMVLMAGMAKVRIRYLIFRGRARN